MRVLNEEFWCEEMIIEKMQLQQKRGGLIHIKKGMRLFSFILDLTDDITETGLLKIQSILKTPECSTLSDLVHVFTFHHTNLNEYMTST